MPAPHGKQCPPACLSASDALSTRPVWASLGKHDFENFLFGGVGKAIVIDFECFVAKHIIWEEGNLSTFLVGDLKSGINCNRDKREETTHFLVPKIH